MPSENVSPEESKMITLSWFLGGSVLGLVMVSIPFWFSAIAWDGAKVGAATGLILLCGFLAARFGRQFVESLMGNISGSGL